MKIVCISDLHGNLGFTVPKCDLLLIAGDIGRYGRNHTLDSNWLKDKFAPWVKNQPAKRVIMTPGNHDIIFEDAISMVPELNCEILIDSMAIEDSSKLKIYGSPWQIAFCHWGFNLSKEKIGAIWDNIPNNIDILLLHGPPYGIGDTVFNGRIKENVGCKKLMKRILEVKPKLVVFGHIHDGHGVYEKDGITFINASLLDERYDMIYQPIIFDMEI